MSGLTNMNPGSYARMKYKVKKLEVIVVQCLAAAPMPVPLVLWLSVDYSSCSSQPIEAKHFSKIYPKKSYGLSKN